MLERVLGRAFDSETRVSVSHDSVMADTARLGHWIAGLGLLSYRCAQNGTEQYWRSLFGTRLSKEGIVAERNLAIVDREQALRNGEPQEVMRGEKEFFPRGAVAFFAVMLISFAVIWLGMYALLWKRQ